MSVAPPPNRLAPVDGLRAVAVLGVIWWHTWIHTGNPAVICFGLNFERLLVPLGTGFQLFFVLSGFCLYLSYQRLREFSAWQTYRRFVRRRWWRLSPAFYFVSLSTAAMLWIPQGHFSGLTLVGHITWLFYWIPGCEILSPVFWTLEVEWEFYLALPLLFSGPGRRTRFGWLVLLVAGCLAWRFWAVVDAADGIATFGTGHLLAHFLPFAWGILAAECWLNHPAWLARIPAVPAVLGGAGLVFFGRGMESTEIFYLAGPFGSLCKTFSEPILTLGYALVLLSALKASNPLLGWLSLPVMQLTGRLSYGLYLWHWLPSAKFGQMFRTLLGETVWAHYLALAATLAVSFPLAGLTYRFLEAPFISGKAKARPSRTTPATVVSLSSRLPR